MQKVTVQEAASSPFVHLDLVRGLAALAVLFGHMRSFVFVSFYQLTSPNLFDIILWTGTGLARQAVIVFFVLSGFFITRSIYQDHHRAGFSWPVYLIKRLSRLWVVLIPCLVLTVICDRLGMFFSPNFYSGHLWSMYSSGPAIETGGTILNAKTFFGNLLFLQDILVSTLGSNGPLWSLAYEFWYYILFPLLFVTYLALAKRSWSVASINGAIFLAICIFVGKYIVLLGVVWLFGAFCYLAYHHKVLGILKSRYALAVALILFLISLAISKGNHGSDYVKDCVLGIGASLLVLVLSVTESPSVLYSKAAAVVAGCSYTVYLVHFPFLALLTNIALANAKFGNSIAGYSVFIGTGIVTLCYCCLIYWLFERNTATVRRYFLGSYKRLKEGPVRAHKSCG